MEKAARAVPRQPPILLRISVPINASPMALSDPFPLHLSIGQNGDRVAHVAVYCSVLERIT